MSRSARTLAAITVAAVALLTPAPGTASHQAPGGAPDGGPVLEPAPPSAPDGHLYDWRGAPDDVPGGYTYDEDEFILTDHPFDDHGADTDGADGRSDNPLEYYSMTEGANAGTTNAGDHTYAADPALRNNAADIVEVRVAESAGSWHLLVVLNTLIDPERTAIGGWITPEGGTTESLLIHGSEGTLGGRAIDIVMDAEQNTIEATIGNDVLDPQNDDVAMNIAAGLWDVAAGAVLDPDPASPGEPWFDLAYVRGEPISYWNENRQSQVLAGAPRDEFVVGFELLNCGDCSAFKARRMGFTTRVFRSGQDLGEGVELATNYDQDDLGLGYRFYRSRYQPYAVYEPWGPEPKPMVILLHFLGGNHMSYPITAMEGIRRWADKLGVLVVMPFARGEAGWYEGPAEKDVFEVWRDAAKHYAIDRERVYLTGMSMGGFGTWRLGALYPDQFARAIVWSGPVTPNAVWPAPAPVTWPYPNPPMCERDAEGCGYQLTDLFGNVSNIPYLVVHGGADELVPSTGALGWMRDFDAQGASPYRFVFYPTRRHETSFPGTTADHVEQWLLDLPTRVRNPSHVRYTVVRDLLQPLHGLIYDRAYWLSGLTLADGAAEGTIEANRDAMDFAAVAEEGTRYGADDLGPYRVDGEQVRVPTARGNGLTLMVQGSVAATADLARAGWDTSEEGWIGVDTEHPLTLTLHASFSQTTAVEGVEAERTADGLILRFPAGESSARIRP